MKNNDNTPEAKPAKDISKIVLTGGPCAGKTTALSWIQNNLPRYGYTVLFVPETATELITSGIAPFNMNSNLDFQKCLMRLQLEKEHVFKQAAENMPAEKVLIVCDRGAMDNKTYMTDEEFRQVCAGLGLNEVELRDSYDAVFHLTTAAKGALEAYTLSNNKARSETPEQAAAIDDKLIAAWTGHPHLRVIDNSTGFEDKLKRLLKEITTFLGEPEPLEIERKFLIEYPDIRWLEAQPNCRKVDIIQTYLEAPQGDEVRVRQRGENGHYIYFQTTKRRISDVKRVEIERRLDQNEYLRLLMNADTTKKQIRKTRYCLMHQNQYFEIDVYPFWTDKAIAEIELSDENAPVLFPDEIRIIKEVTDDPSYRNSSLAAGQNVFPEAAVKVKTDNEKATEPVPATASESASKAVNEKPKLRIEIPDFPFEEMQTCSDQLLTRSEQIALADLISSERADHVTIGIDKYWPPELTEHLVSICFEEALWNYHDESWSEYEVYYAFRITKEVFEKKCASLKKTNGRPEKRFLVKAEECFVKYTSGKVLCCGKYDEWSVSHYYVKNLEGVPGYLHIINAFCNDRD